MIAVALALGAAVVYGAGDFCGGLATRRSRPLAVTVVSHLVGLAIVLAALPIFPPDVWRASDFGWGAIGGVLGGAGVALLYWGLAAGTMSVVAPVTGLMAAAVPVLAGLGMGERPAPIALVGIAAAMGAIVLVTWQPRREAPAPHVSARVVGLAVAAGLAFGVFFILLDRTSSDAGLFPLLGVRIASIALVGSIAVTTRSSLRPTADSLRPTLLAGVLDMGANILYLLAVREGLLAVVAVLTALYPATTVILAQRLLAERLQPSQMLGLGTAAVAAAFIAVG
ncbi:MAG: EamA family transporter [Acidimicrobiales bacterium]